MTSGVYHTLTWVESPYIYINAHNFDTNDKEINFKKLYVHVA